MFYNVLLVAFFSFLSPFFYLFSFFLSLVFLIFSYDQEKGMLPVELHRTPDPEIASVTAGYNSMVALVEKAC